MPQPPASALAYADKGLQVRHDWLEAAEAESLFQRFWEERQVAAGEVAVEAGHSTSLWQAEKSLLGHNGKLSSNASGRDNRTCSGLKGGAGNPKLANTWLGCEADHGTLQASATCVDHSQSDS